MDQRHDKRHGREGGGISKSHTVWAPGKGFRFPLLPHLFTQRKFLDLHDKECPPNLNFQNHCMSLKTRQTHGLSHFPLIEHRSCCVFSSTWRREGDGAGRNGCDLRGNTSRSIPAPGLSGPIAGPQLAAACPLQRPRFQPVPITATESWLARDESPSSAKTLLPQKRTLSNPQIRL